MQESLDHAVAADGDPWPSRLGPFLVERELGRGGSGVVFEARLGDRPVALKVPHAELPLRDQKHFLQEAELLARITHRAIVECLDAGTLPDGRPYLAMTLLEGMPLSRRIERGRLPAEFAIELFTPLAEAVVHLHASGIVHRDIKPENVFYLEAEGRLVLLDFGIAREASRPPSTTTQANRMRGTPATMAPERFFGTPATPSSDVYELAVVLFAMLTGTFPWGNSTDPQARLSPRHPAELGVQLPQSLEQVIMEALSTRVERRPTALELLKRVADASGSVREPVVGAPFSRETQDLPAEPTSAKGTLRSGPASKPLVEAPSDPKATTAPPSRKAALWVTPLAIGVLGTIVVGAIVLTSLRGAKLPSRARATITPFVAEKVRVLLPAPVPTVAPSAIHLDSGTTPDALTSSTSDTGARAPSVARTSTGMFPQCRKMLAVFCTPEARKLPGGDERCARRQSEVAKLSALSPKLQARSEAYCRETTAELERHVKTPQADESPAAMPWCARVQAAYCDPTSTIYGASALCAQWKQRMDIIARTFSAADRKAEDQKCEMILPGVVGLMKGHSGP